MILFNFRDTISYIRGLPYWLREVPGIIFRSDNEPYKKHMSAFVGKIIQMMKDEKLFAPQGGPIILAQVFIFYIAFYG